jgi:hypothetical protein
MNEKNLEVVKTRLNTRIKMHQDTLKKFDEDIKKNSYTHALIWMTEEVIKAEALLDEDTQMLTFINSDQFNLETLKKEQDQRIAYLIQSQPWQQNSTSAMANVESAVRASIIAEIIKELNDFIDWLA